MIKLHYSKAIKAPARKVFDSMLGIGNKKTYEHWTAEFNPTSTYEGEWKKGGKMYFVGTDDKGKRGGMVSEIAELLPGRFVSIRHYGMLDGDTEITEGELVEKWAGSLENYTFSEQQGVTTVAVSIDMAEDYQDYFNATWPRALEKLRELAEE